MQKGPNSEHQKSTLLELGLFSPKVLLAGARSSAQPSLRVPERLASCLWEAVFVKCYGSRNLPLKRKEFSIERESDSFLTYVSPKISKVALRTQKFVRCLNCRSMLP